MTSPHGNPATGGGRPVAQPQKVTRPGGQPGGSGCDTGWMRRPCRTRNPRSKRFRAKRGFAGSRQENASAKPLGRSVRNCSCERGRCSCRKRRTGEPSRSGDSRRSSSRRCAAIAVPTIGGADQAGADAPAEAAALAWAWVVEVAIVPVTASAATARAAILVLIDMRNSILLRAAPLWSACPVGRSLSDSGSKPGRGNSVDWLFR